MKNFCLVGIIMILSFNLLVAESDEKKNTCIAISANVLGIATLNPTLDLEIPVFDNFTFGGTVWWEVKDVEDRWWQLRLGYYTSDNAFKGLGFSLTAGYHIAYNKDSSDKPTETNRSAATLGLLGHYTWRFLESEKLFLSIVAGAKVTLDNNILSSPLKMFYGEGRLNVGWAF